MLSIMAFDTRLPLLARLVNRFHPHTRGWLAEKVALAYLLAHGFWPAARPLRAHVQTDLLLTCGAILCVVEVKYRAQNADMALGIVQIRRLQRECVRLAALFPHHTVRGDVVLVQPVWPFVRHRAGAISLE